MSSEECQYQDWRAKGQVDGAQGKSTDTFTNYVRACARHGLAPNQIDYMAGRDDGLKVFCTPQNGFATGDGGERYQYVCPPALEPGFLSAYNLGYDLYGRWSEVNRLVTTISSNRYEIGRLEGQVEDAEADLNKASTDEERQRLISSIKEKSMLIGELREGIQNARRMRAPARLQCVQAKRKAEAAGYDSLKTCLF